MDFQLVDSWTVYLECPGISGGINSNNNSNSKGKDLKNLVLKSHADSWLATLIVVVSFASAADFWSWFNNTLLLSNFYKTSSNSSNSSSSSSSANSNAMTISSVRIFKKDISVASEDDKNCYGGRIILSCSATNTDEIVSNVESDSNNNVSNPVDKFWLLLLLWTISGSENDCYEHINGVVAKSWLDRKNNAIVTKYEIWLASSSTNITTDLLTKMNNTIHNCIATKAGISTVQLQYKSHLG